MKIVESDKPVYRPSNISNFRNIPQFQQYLTEEQLRAIEVVGSIFPFKINNYVINELIDWNNVHNDPIFRLLVPHKEMLQEAHFNKLKKLLDKGVNHPETVKFINDIRSELNPHPAGQMEYNIPLYHGKKPSGIQHKYDETLLFFPSHGQTCHSYCTFCFRWPQFIGINELKFAAQETNTLVNYLLDHPKIKDVLFTGGDPLIMSAKRLESYIEPLLKVESLRTIRLGSKALGFWPYRFLTDKDADDLLRLFERVIAAGKHLAFMAHFSHPVEHKTEAVKQAIKRIIGTGSQIRTQSPLIRHVNDDPLIWKEMWEIQVNLGCIPYYMFLARDTGAQEYFAVPLVKALHIYREAYSQVSGIARTVRGPSMSVTHGKVQVTGIAEIHGEKVMVLQFIQGRSPDWVNKPFFAQYNESAIWLNELKPAFGEENFFFEEPLKIDAEGNVLLNQLA